MVISNIVLQSCHLPSAELSSVNNESFLGRWRSRQDPSALAPLLHGNTGSHFRRRLRGPRPD